MELETGRGLAVLDACRKLGITEQTYRWKKEYGGLRVDQAKRLKSMDPHGLTPVVPSITSYARPTA